ncbi:unnamed protein product [Closterium sp. Naga37s-1]|nr:unnamed protein product [Closterium sp. Naga37s-1]
MFVITWLVNELARGKGGGGGGTQDRKYKAEGHPTIVLAGVEYESRFFQVQGGRAFHDSPGRGGKYKAEGHPTIVLAGADVPTTEPGGDGHHPALLQSVPISFPSCSLPCLLPGSAGGDFRLIRAHSPQQPGGNGHHPALLQAPHQAPSLLPPPFLPCHTHLQGVRAVISVSFERIHRSNLVGMGIVPLCFKPLSFLPPVLLSRLLSPTITPQGVRAVISVSFERIHRSNLVGMGIIPLCFKPLTKLPHSCPHLFCLVTPQGVRAVISVSFERIHRSNLVGMGIIPLCFKPGQNAETLGLTGKERFSFSLPPVDQIQPGQDVVVSTDNGKSFTCTLRFDTEIQPGQDVVVSTDNGKSFTCTLRFDTELEKAYYNHGGILHFVLRQLLAKSTAA